MERRIALRKNDELMNKFIDRSCSKFRMRENELAIRIKIYVN